MKLGLAVLPLEVWTDVFVYPWITRQQLAQIVDQFKNRKFAEKLQFRLHDMGKQSLGFLEISSKPPDEKFVNNSYVYQLRKRKIPERPASFAVTSSNSRALGFSVNNWPSYQNYGELPENITKFKRISIEYLDDHVMNFLGKLKPLLNNVFLNMVAMESADNENMRILFTHLLPILTNIRGICCTNEGIEFLEQHFPHTLADAKELSLFATSDFIPAYLRWLNTPQDFDQHGPRFLRIFTRNQIEILCDFVVAVAKQFRRATTSATFVIFAEFYAVADYSHEQAIEHTFQNAATNEQLTVRNVIFQRPNYASNIHYVELVRHPVGEEAKIREWIKRRAYYEKKHEKEMDGSIDEPEQMISIAGQFQIAFGRIIKKKNKVAASNQCEDQPAGEEDEAGPSTKKMKQ